jgi:sulfite reductase (NADPH) flavoprotein alpha-component
MTHTIPVIPDNAPFTAAQRAWLNGFLAGIYSGTPAGGAPLTPAAPAAPKTSLAILFGSESGNSEALSKRLAKAAIKRGFEAKAMGLDKITAADLGKQKYVLIVTSTYGDGEPPENAKAFHAGLHAETQPRLEGLKYSVLSLGDHNYEHYCRCGQEIDTRLAALGAQRVYERMDCDVDFEASFERWQEGVFGVLEAMAKEPAAPAPAAAAPSPAPKAEAPAEVIAFSRKNPFPAKLVTNRKLTGEGSAKETRHFEISLAGSGLVYEAGDALGVVPTNCPALVDDLLRALNCDGEEAVPAPDGGESSLRTALLRQYEISKIPPALLKTIAERSSDKTLAELMVPEAKDALAHYLYGRETIDLLLDFASVSFKPAELVSHLRKLQPRLYSISSSLKAFPEQVHLTVAAVRYDAFGRPRKGVCSTFLADRASGPVPVFVHSSAAFRLPKSGDTPIIMVGPGTGVAPFRAFLHDRRTAGAKGENWLFFGEQRSATDFFYREELESMQADSHLSRLSLAFSRDQAEKVYVQNRMVEEGADLWAWLEEGAHFYVCGDASRMAKDVDAALHAVIERHGGRTPDAAADYVKKLKTDKRYQRDVY